MALGFPLGFGFQFNLGLQPVLYLSYSRGIRFSFRLGLCLGSFQCLGSLVFGSGLFLDLSAELLFDFGSYLRFGLKSILCLGYRLDISFFLSLDLGALFGLGLSLSPDFGTGSFFGLGFRSFFGFGPCFRFDPEPFLRPGYCLKIALSLSLYFGTCLGFDPNLFFGFYSGFNFGLSGGLSFGLFVGFGFYLGLSLVDAWNQRMVGPVFFSTNAARRHELLLRGADLVLICSRARLPCLLCCLVINTHWHASGTVTRTLWPSGSQIMK